MSKTAKNSLVLFLQTTLQFTVVLLKQPMHNDYIGRNKKRTGNVFL